MAEINYSSWLERYGLEELRRLAEDGLNEEEIAIRCGIRPALLRVWKKKYPDLSEAIALGKKDSDLAVVKSLYRKAVGYNVALKKIYKLKRVDFDPDTGKKIREYEELATGIEESHVPADLRAETFWLKSRQGERWGDGADREYSDEEEDESGVIQMPLADRIDEPSTDYENSLSDKD